MIIVILLLLMIGLVSILIACDDTMLKVEALSGLLVLGVLLYREVAEVRFYRHRTKAFVRWATTCYDPSVPFEVEDAHIQQLHIRNATVHNHLADLRDSDDPPRLHPE